MKNRKVKDIIRTLNKKSFKLTTEKEHHKYYYLFVEGKKYPIYTYISLGKKEYDKNLMGEIKKQLKFQDAKKAEDFFDCTLSGPEYINMLKEINEIPS